MASFKKFKLIIKKIIKSLIKNLPIITLLVLLINLTSNIHDLINFTLKSSPLFFIFYPPTNKNKK